MGGLATSHVVVLHLSDLHYRADKETETEMFTKALLRDLDLQGTQIDCVVFSGDLTYSGKPEQFFGAYDHFIEPVTKFLGIEDSLFLMAPGNHDVDRDSPDVVSSLGLEKLDSLATANKYLDAVEKRSAVMKHLEAFNGFSDALYSGSSLLLKASSSLWRGFDLTIGPARVGIVCLNSAWRSRGGVSDNGRILIGEHQVETALASLQEFDFRIAILHHPLSMLASLDNTTGRRITDKFDLICFGHNHDSDAVLIRRGKNATVLSQTGSIVEREGCFPGYTLLEIDTGALTVKVSLREFSEHTKEFGAAVTRLGPDGSATYGLRTPDKKGEESLQISSKVAEIEERIDNSMLPVLSKSPHAPDHLRDIFVEPLLMDKPKHEVAEQQAEQLKLIGLLQGSKDIAFIGKPESGKTVLLEYIQLLSLSFSASDGREPIYIKFRNVPPKGHNRLEKVIFAELRSSGAYSGQNLVSLLEGGLLTVLIDDIDPEDEKRLEAIRAFAKTYPGVRLIVTTDEVLLRQLRLKSLPDLGRDFDEIYIHPFLPSHVRDLAAKWFANSDIDYRDMANVALKHLRSVHLPWTPMIVTLLIRVLEEEPDYKAINRAALISRFINLTLQVPNGMIIARGTYDLRTREAFLAHLARAMSERNTFSMKKVEFAEFVLSYFERLGMDPPNDPLSLGPGILTQAEGRVYFRYRCFEEYFCAVAMRDNLSFKHNVLTTDNYLRYANELDFLTGLERNNVDVVNFVRGQVDEAIKRIPVKDLDSLNKVYIEERLSKAMEALDELPDNDQLEDELEAQNPSASDVQTDEKPTVEDPTGAFFSNLMLFGSVIRNCELLDGDLKRDLVKKCVEGFGLALASFFNDLDKIIAGIDLSELRKMLPSGDEEIDTKEVFVRSQIKYLISILMPVLVQAAVEDALGTPKLKKQIDSLIEEADNEFIKLILVCLYGDLRLPGYLQHFENLLTIKNRSILEIAKYKLLGLYLSGAQHREEMEPLMARFDLTIEKRTKRDKGQAIERMRKVRTIIDRRNAESSQEQNTGKDS